MTITSCYSSPTLNCSQLLKKSVVCIILVLQSFYILNAKEAAGKDVAKSGMAQGYCEIVLGGKNLTSKTHAIVIPDIPSASEEYAAEELQYHFKLLTGQKLSILKDSEVNDDKRSFFIIGKSHLLKEYNINVDWEKLGSDGIFIKASGQHLFLTGGRRGALYACYSLLEDYLNVRWFTLDCMRFPKEGRFILDGIEKNYIPILEYRESHGAMIRNVTWTARNKINGSDRLVEKYGGYVSYGKFFVHTLNYFVPVQKYFETHPEYFSEINGKRQRGKTRGLNGITYTQLCFSNPEVEKLILSGVRQALRENPDINIISVSQNDGGVPCECPKCKAIDEEEESQSGSLLRMVNKVAEQIEKDFPTVYIDTIAYTYSRKPPKLTKPRSNVIIRLSDIECSFASPLAEETTEKNREFCKDMQGWAKNSSKLYIWHYVTNFRWYLLPHPNLRTLKPDIQFFIKNKIRGIFTQGNTQSLGGEFDELRTWMLAKLLWNPDENSEKLIDEFLAGYYGAAAPFFLEYINLIHDSAEKTKPELNCYTKEDSPFLTLVVLNKASLIFDNAENAVKTNPVLLKRVQIARLPVIFAILQNYSFAYIQKGNTLIPLLSANEKENLLRNFKEITKLAGLTHLWEGWESSGNSQLDTWISQKQGGGENMNPHQLENDYLQIDILAELGGRIWKLKDLKSGKEVFRSGVDSDGIQIDKGGYEEYSSKLRRSPGWCEKYQIKEKSKQKIVLEAAIDNDLILNREIELPMGTRGLKITSTLTNNAETPRKTCLRIHPEFTISNPENILILLKKNDGRFEEKILLDCAPKSNYASIEFQGANRPTGEWGFWDKKKELGVMNRFEQSEVSLCFIYSSFPDKHINLELRSIEKDLKPLESVVIHQSYEIISEFPEKNKQK